MKQKSLKQLEETNFSIFSRILHLVHALCWGSQNNRQNVQKRHNYLVTKLCSEFHKVKIFMQAGLEKTISPKNTFPN